MNWPAVLQTILIGTDRRKLPEEAAIALGLHISEDPVKTALEALASAALLRKAGASAAVVDVFAASEPSVGEASGQPVLKEVSVGYLKRMLSGTYAEGLPEFVDLMQQRGYRLPPELLPDLLDLCLQEPAFAARLAPALGKRGHWLAQQNERWHSLVVDVSATDWFTAAFEERRQLLALTRSRNPLLAIAWLEKTWREEKTEHKIQFIQLLSIRLSDMDQTLLEQAFHDKNRELRLAALNLLVALPEHRVKTDMCAFFKTKLADAVLSTRREQDLQSLLPDLSDGELKPWFDLLSKTEKSDWRNGLLQFFVRYLPPSELLELTGSSPDNLVPALDAVNQTALSEALLDNLLRHQAAHWVEAVWQHYSNHFRHPIWQKPAMQAFMHRYVDELMQHLATTNRSLDYDSQFVLRALENYRKPWSKSLFNNLLQQYRTAVSGNMPGWHYALVLQIAAWHCHLPDGLAFFDASATGPGTFQPKEWVAFQNVLYFRQQMRQQM